MRDSLLHWKATYDSVVLHSLHAGKEQVSHKHDECKDAKEANPRLAQYEELALQCL
jgi:hypothetical protein